MQRDDPSFRSYLRGILSPHYTALRGWQNKQQTTLADYAQQWTQRLNTFSSDWTQKFADFTALWTQTLNTYKADWTKRLDDFATSWTKTLADFKTAWDKTLADYKLLWDKTLADYKTAWDKTLADYKLLWDKTLADYKLEWTKKLDDGLSLKANIDNQALTGTPTTPTAAVDTNSKQIANTAFVAGQASSTAPLMDGAASAGSSLRFSRDNHVHPTDSSRAAAVHTHTSSQVTDLAAAMSGKSDIGHGHAITDVANLQATLNTKATTNTAIRSNGNGAGYTGFQLASGADLGSIFAAAAHSHAITAATVAVGVGDTLAGYSLVASGLSVTLQQHLVNCVCVCSACCDGGCGGT